MRKAVVITLMVVAVSLWGLAAQAMEKPEVYMPKDGQLLGPNFDIMGRMPAKAFLIVMTDVIISDTGEMIKSVPGIRHWTEPDGTFHFRCASPRVAIGEKDTQLNYRIRVFEASASGDTGPETVIEGKMPQ
jgi:hypothetical protein